MRETTPRPINDAVYDKALGQGIPPMTARIIAARVTEANDDLLATINPTLSSLHAPTKLLGAVVAGKRVADAIVNKERIGVLTDYDVDGITSHAIIKTSLSEFFNVDDSLINSILGHRLKDGYGINNNLVLRILDLPLDERPELIISADCGSSDEDRIKLLKDAGIDVVITDHHLVPDTGAPVSAIATVNPNQPGCEYPDKAIAGCFVAWLLMCQVKKELHLAISMAHLLDYVALGTVADAVSLFSPSNRCVVNHGLKLMNEMKRPCWQAFSELAKKQGKPVSVTDLGFQLGPRINARSRMADPYAALYYLMGRDLTESFGHLRELDVNNEERKKTEKGMVAIAKNKAAKQTDDLAIVVYDDSFHAGVQGIVASRLVDSTGKPAVMLSPIEDKPDLLTGSCRTIPSLHIRDCLQHIDDNTTDILQGYGGHSGAAGLKIKADRIEDFRAALNLAVIAQLGENPDLTPTMTTDGILSPDLLSLDSYNEIQQLQPYGREFEEPVFEGVFTVQSTNMVGADPVHMQITVLNNGQKLKGIWFRAIAKSGDPLPFGDNDKIHCVYSMDKNEWNGYTNLQLIIRDAKKVQ